MDSTTPPSSSGFLDVGQGHQIFYQIFGPDDGIPFIFLHGGPGSGFNLSYCNCFTGTPVRLITFDQRGSGQSIPTGISEANTTQHLIDDIEVLRKFLKIKKWFVSGHSWGSTLALLYAMQHKERCHALALASIFLGRKSDHDWTFNGSKMFMADVFEKVQYEFNKEDSFEEFLYDRLLNGTDAEKKDAAYRYAYLSSSQIRLVPNLPKLEDITKASVNKAVLFFYYVLNHFFIPENFILENVHLLKDLPIKVVHGRFDMDCYPKQAFELKEALPHIDLRIALGAHGTAESAMLKTYNEIICDIIKEHAN